MDMEKKVLELPLDDVLPNRFQPRIKFNEKTINELAESIKKHGVIQPIVVRQIGDKYEIIAGERRYKASVLAGKETIPAIVANLDDRDSAEVALIENVQREDLTAIEEASSYKKILDMGYLTQAQLAEKLGKEQSTIANKIRLLNLSEEAQEALLYQEISERHARSLLRLDADTQKSLLKRITDERLTVRKTDEIIDQLLNKNNNVEILDFSNVEVAKKEEPMVEQKEINNFNLPIEPIVEEIQPETNPGFVDLAKMESQAQDIFKETPVVDMSSFLETPKTEVEASLNTTTETNSDAYGLKPKKYFNLNFEDETETSKIPTIEVFNGFVAPPIIETTPAAPVVDQPAMPNVETPQVTTEQPTTNNFDFNSFYNQTPTTPVVEIKPIEPVESPMPPIVEMPTFVEQPVVEMPTFVEQPVVEMPIIEEAKSNNQFVVGDLKTVINTIRTCASTIEKYGYIIDTEEFDFEDMYQVIFKITKK